jgi:hypothetical protein
VDTVALANYYAGYGVQRSPIEAWRVDREIARGMGVPVGTPVFLSYENFSKISVTHREIGFSDFARLRELITSPLTFVSTGHHRSAEFTHALRERPLRFILRATRLREVYLVSMYRQKWPDVRRLYGRAKRENRLIRDLETELARQLVPRQSRT